MKMKILVLVHAPRNAPRSDELLVDGLRPDDLTSVVTGRELARATGGELVALMAGPPSFDPILQLAIDAGANSGRRVWSSHLRDDHNIYAVSRLLAQAISQIGFDLVLAGYRSTNWATGMMGPALAYQLGVPLVSQAARIEIAEGDNQETETQILELDKLYGSQRLRIRLAAPALVTLISDPSRPARPATVPTDEQRQRPQFHDLGERTPTTPTMRFSSNVLPTTRSVEMLTDASALLKKLRWLGIIR